MTMTGPIIQLFRSRWLALGVHAGLWVLLYLIVIKLGGKAPEHRDSGSFFVPPQMPVPVSKLADLFPAEPWWRPTGGSNPPINAFFTMHFVPPPSPTPPAPPSTKKIEVVYQGFYQTADSGQRVIVKVADGFVIAGVGKPVATNHYIAAATMQSLWLTNSAAQTNLLPLNVKKEIEVPIK